MDTTNTNHQAREAGAVDIAGYPLSTTAAAARHYRQGVELLLALQPGAGDSFAAAVASDETFALAHASLAVTRAFYGQTGDPVEAISAAMAHAPAATRRERQHVEALATTFSGDRARSASLASEHLAEFPRDHVIAYVAVMSSHWYGDTTARHDSQKIVEAAARHATDDDWAFHAIHAFALEEQHQLERAEHEARRSLTVRPDSGEAAHVLAHVLYEQGRHIEGLQFIEEWVEQHYRPGAPNWIHIQWHAALFELELDRVDDALERYRKHISPLVAGPSALIDATSLLWRLWLDGHDPLPVDDLHDAASGAMQNVGWTFADWHTGLALALTGESARRDDFLTSLERLTEAGHPTARLAHIVTEAARELVNSRYAEAAGHLEAALSRPGDLGGSHAQVDVLTQTMIHALARSGARSEACKFVNDRLDRAPSPRSQRLRDELASGEWSRQS